MHIDLTGIVTPLATPFAKGGESIDTAAFRKLIDAVIGSGVKAIIANAATSQFSALDDKEREGELAEARRSADSWCKPPAPAGAAGAAPPG